MIFRKSTFLNVRNEHLVSTEFQVISKFEESWLDLQKDINELLCPVLYDRICKTSKTKTKVNSKDFDIIEDEEYIVVYRFHTSVSKDTVILKRDQIPMNTRFRSNKLWKDKDKVWNSLPVSLPVFKDKIVVVVMLKSDNDTLADKTLEDLDQTMKSRYFNKYYDGNEMKEKSKEILHRLSTKFKKEKQVDLSSNLKNKIEGDKPRITTPRLNNFKNTVGKFTRQQNTLDNYTHNPDGNMKKNIESMDSGYLSKENVPPIKRVDEEKDDTLDNYSQSYAHKNKNKNESPIEAENIIFSDNNTIHSSSSDLEDFSDISSKNKAPRKKNYAKTYSTTRKRKRENTKVTLTKEKRVSLVDINFFSGAGSSVEGNSTKIKSKNLRSSKRRESSKSSDSSKISSDNSKVNSDNEGCKSKKSCKTVEDPRTTEKSKKPCRNTSAKKRDANKLTIDELLKTKDDTDVQLEDIAIVSLTMEDSCCADEPKVNEEHLKNIEELSPSDLAILVCKFKDDMKSILNGKIPCDRHNTFKAGGKEKALLEVNKIIGLFNEDQNDQINKSLMKMFCAKTSKYFDYVMKVLVPEVTVMIYAHVNKITNEEANQIIIEHF